MARNDNYSTEAQQLVPLTTDDVREVSENIKSFTKNRNKEVEKFLLKAFVTAQTLNDLKFTFQTELESKLKQGPLGTPSNLSPKEAAKFLSHDELNALFDSFMRQKLAAVDYQIQKASDNALQVEAVVNTLKKSVNELLSDDSVDLKTRQKFAATLDEAVAAAATLKQEN